LYATVANPKLFGIPGGVGNGVNRKGYSLVRCLSVYVSNLKYRAIADDSSDVGVAGDSSSGDFVFDHRIALAAQVEIHGCGITKAPIRDLLNLCRIHLSDRSWPMSASGHQQ
jgi:hypothetical protein